MNPDSSGFVLEPASRCSSVRNELQTIRVELQNVYYFAGETLVRKLFSFENFCFLLGKVQSWQVKRFLISAVVRAPVEVWWKPN